MKPILLTIQAFGPFAHIEKINFEELGTNPLFLINGPTGAGKSSILDAICFALYGKTTGDERTPDQMRCDFADISLLTEVSFEFSITGQVYRIRRVPMQQRAKSKGEGSTTQNSEANIWVLDGSKNGQLIVSSKVTEADSFIKNLLGLDVEQFRQVMVLPQGKFRDFLLADSKKREEIFSQLFQTSIYKRIEEGLKAKAADIQKQIKERENTIKGYLESAGATSEQELNQSLTTLSSELEHLRQEKRQSECAKQRIQKAYDDGSALNKKFDEYEFKRKEYEHHLDNEHEISLKKERLSKAIHAHNIMNVYERYIDKQYLHKKAETLVSAAQQEKQKADKQYTSSQIEYDKAKQAHKTVEQLQKNQTLLEQKLLVAQNIEVANNALKQSKAKYNECKQYVDNAKEQRSGVATLIQTNESMIEQLTEQTSHLVDEKTTLNQLKDVLEKRIKLDTISKSVINLQQHVSALEDQYSKSLHVLKQSESVAKHKEMTWHLSQAAQLANALGDGEPCPVCGSIEHPKKARHANTSEVVTKADLDNARAVIAENRKIEQSDHNDVMSVTNELKQKQSECKELSDNLNKYADLSLESVQNMFDTQSAKVEALTSKLNQEKSLKEEIKKLKNGLAEQDLAIEQQTATLNDLRSDKIKAQTTLDNLRKQFNNEPLKISEIRKLIQENANNITTLTNNYENASSNLKHANNVSIKANEQLALSQKQLSQALHEYDLATQKWSETLDSSMFLTEEAFKKAQLDEKQKQAITQEIEDYQVKAQQLVGALNQLELYLKNKTRIDLITLETLLKDATSSLELTQRLLQTIENTYFNLKSSKNLFDKAKKENEKQDKEYEVIGTLAEVATGRSGEKISLQRFILSVLLDDVLIQASHRLLKMSKGRYQLVRNLDRARGNKASGLELLVDDTYTGKARPVSTLSGGESFMAALSLALGLSDVVQSYSGGVKLDTLFIDEGFGSLDQESLELAINTLIDLQSSGRTIGIISHVTELKSQMGTRIDIRADKDGSRIKTIGT